MFARNKRFAPELLKDVNLDDDVDVIAGLRPYRVENVCVEKEYGFNIVHNYGHGGSGFSLSYGCAREAIGLLESMEGPSFRVVDLRPQPCTSTPTPTPNCRRPTSPPLSSTARKSPSNSPSTTDRTRVSEDRHDPAAQSSHRTNGVKRINLFRSVAILRAFS
ncbi:FAD-dependent oxidoreductase [Streptomyces anulatus]|uniref:D-amino-acid oxidase n=1 Tax=Streptomyces anulatus TaxID=1892 RepID=A0A7K3R5D3_STRAQ|nr:FAD-dependent oxidoreductase [Streptomyces anulatus]NEB97335.1 FAD-binding oxidoreductase [Streptomyces anulatus]NED26437.1 FAD-binding oxidoreductase [Streptomyces anulatus]